MDWGEKLKGKRDRVEGPVPARMELYFSCSCWIRTAKVGEGGGQDPGGREATERSNGDCDGGRGAGQDARADKG